MFCRPASTAQHLEVCSVNSCGGIGSINDDYGNAALYCLATSPYEIDPQRLHRANVFFFLSYLPDPPVCSHSSVSLLRSLSTSPLAHIPPSNTQSPHHLFLFLNHSSLTPDQTPYVGLPLFILLSITTHKLALQLSIALMSYLSPVCPVQSITI